MDKVIVTITKVDKETNSVSYDHPLWSGAHIKHFPGVKVGQKWEITENGNKIISTKKISD